MHFNMTVNLAYSPPMTTDNGYFRTIFSDLFSSNALYRRREASACPIILSNKQGSLWYHFQCMWYGADGYRILDLDADAVPLELPGPD